jgi:molybdate transport system permease protein
MTLPISADDWGAVALTLKLAFTTTVLLLVLATPLAWWLANTRSAWRRPVGAMVSLPMVLPPTVLGFYLLVTLGPQGPVGQLMQALGWGLLPFTFAGLVVGSVVYSLPFAVQPLQNAFEAMGRRPMEVAARPGLLSATVMSFAHTVGEFGVVLMLGGNIPDETRVASVQIYGHVEALQYTEAHWLSAGMVVFSFGVLWLMAWLNPRSLRILP